MRRIFLLIILCVCASGAFAYNERVAAIAYNPSRLGAYTHLKAVKEATFAGGVTCQADMNINSTGTVRFTRGSQVDQNLLQCGPTDGCAITQDHPLHTITNIQPAAGSDVWSKCTQGKCTTGKTKANTFLVMQKPVQTRHESYSAQSTSSDPASDGTVVTMAGGRLEAAEDSYIASFTGNNSTVENLTLKANTIHGNIHVTDSFTFGNVTVEVPSGNLFFKEITDKDDNTVKVLAAN